MSISIQGAWTRKKCIHRQSKIGPRAGGVRVSFWATVQPASSRHCLLFHHFGNCQQTVYGACSGFVWMFWWALTYCACLCDSPDLGETVSVDSTMSFHAVSTSQPTAHINCASSGKWHTHTHAHTHREAHVLSVSRPHTGSLGGRSKEIKPQSSVTTL